MWGYLGECGATQDRGCVSFQGHIFNKKHTSKHTTVMTTTRPKMDAISTKLYNNHTTINFQHDEHDEHALGQVFVFWGVAGGVGGVEACTHPKAEHDHGGLSKRRKPGPSSNK
jgi:hypothetical protein